MKIILTRSGGFTGIPLTKTIDTTTLPEEQAKKIDSLIQNASLTQTRMEKTSQQPDRFLYTLTIQTETTTKNIAIQENNLTKDMQALILQLQSLG